MTTKTYAVIDVGTLKSKFEIRQFQENGKSKLLHKDKQLTVLGRDLQKNKNRIIRSAERKTTKALAEFRKKMAEHKVDDYRAITTEAIRQAENAQDVLKRINDKTGISLEVLSQQEEAELYFYSVAKEFPNDVIAVSDIGGGSVQVVIGKGKDIYDVFHYKTGVYFMQENFSDTHHPTHKELEEARKFIKKEMRNLNHVRKSVNMLIYGTTNIIDFLKAMKVPMKRQNLPEHPYYTYVKELVPVYENIIKYSYEDRMPMFPEEPYYMWAADKALMNIFQISENLGISKIVPSNNNLSTGILHKLCQS